MRLLFTFRDFRAWGEAMSPLQMLAIKTDLLNSHFLLSRTSAFDRLPKRLGSANYGH